MKNVCAPFLTLSLMIATIGFFQGPFVVAAEWLSMPSTFTHSPMSGDRVNQYSQVEAPPIVDQSRRITSGYTHFRSTIQVGQSADNYHRVDEWGPPVRPYGEWRFPYRPYSVPYSEWGAPFAGLNLGFGFPGAFPGTGHPGNWNSGNWNPGNGHPGNGHPGNGHPGVGQPGQRFPGGNQGGIPGQPYEPYPANPGAGYPVPPWYDGSYPDYDPIRPMTDREFFRSPLDRQ